MTDITIVRAVRTGIACPSQWDAWDADGNYYYLRYRGGHGSVCQYADENWADAPWTDDTDQSKPGWAVTANTSFIRHVTDFAHGHPLDGSIELGDFCRIAGLNLAPGAMVTGYGDYVADQLILDGTVSPDVFTADD